MSPPTHHEPILNLGLYRTSLILPPQGKKGFKILKKKKILLGPINQLLSKWTLPEIVLIFSNISALTHHLQPELITYPLSAL